MTDLAAPTDTTDTTDTTTPKRPARSAGLSLDNYAGNVASSVADIGALAKRQGDVMDRLLSKQEKAIDEGEKESKEAFKQITPFKPMPPPDQRQYQTDPLQSFFSLGSVFGILASAFTHQPWTTSFDAAAAAINARNQGDAQAYDHAFQAWKENTDLMFKRHELQMNDWKSINENTKNDLGLRDALIRGYEARYGDQISATYRAAGLQGQLEEIMAKRQEISLKMQMDYPKIVEQGLLTGAMLKLKTAIDSGDTKQIKERSDELRELQGIVSPQLGMAAQRLVASSLGQPQMLTLKGDKQVYAQQDKAGVLGTPGAWYSADEKRTPIDSSQIQAITPSSQSMPPQTPNQREANAAQIATGEPISQVIPGWGGAANAARQQAKSDAIDLIMKQNPGMKPAEAGVVLAQRSVSFLAGKASVSQLNTMLGATRQAVSQLEFNVGKVKEEMKRVGSTNISPILNAIARGEERWTGDPAYSSLFFYMSGVAAESARILSGGQASRAQLHAGAMEEAQKWASINMTPAAFDDVAKSMISEGQNRIDNFSTAIAAQQVGGGAPSPVPTQSETPEPSKVIQYNAKGEMVQ